MIPTLELNNSVSLIVFYVINISLSDGSINVCARASNKVHTSYFLDYINGEVYSSTCSIF